MMYIVKQSTSLQFCLKKKNEAAKLLASMHNPILALD